ncbi:MAG TPA: histidine phosphatase family protein [Pseudomonadales bacterium]|nr:histidine phosphatase family protein [Pseudomonadales bacterium]HJP50605.1 histidine phosphatase family protein [Pseudomonadales bacterium]
MSLVGFDNSCFDVIYWSSLKRCRQTAECGRLYTEEFEQFNVFDDGYVMPAGESRRVNLDRVLSWLNDLEHSDRILAVAHGGPIDFICRIAAGIEMHGGRMFGSSNANIFLFARSGRE